MIGDEGGRVTFRSWLWSGKLWLVPGTVGVAICIVVPIFFAPHYWYWRLIFVILGALNLSALVSYCRIYFDFVKPRQGAGCDWWEIDPDAYHWEPGENT